MTSGELKLNPPPYFGEPDLEEGVVQNGVGFAKMDPTRGKRAEGANFLNFEGSKMRFARGKRAAGANFFDFST